jgi:hypothetical protein
MLPGETAFTEYPTVLPIYDGMGRPAPTQVNAVGYSGKFMRRRN